MGKLSLGELDSIINRKREQDEYPKAAAPYINDIDAAADRYGVPREYARRLVQTESNFNPNAVSPAGAQGLMQIVPKWHPNVDPFNPKEAIDYGIRYLRENADRFGKDGQPDWRAGAAAYNAGPGTVERRGMDNLPAETRAYVPKVIGEGQPSQPASPQRKTRLSFNDIDSIINSQEPDGFLSKAATMGGALVKGLAEGVTTEIPGMIGGAAQFAGSKLGAEGVEEGGRELKEWAEKKSKEWFGESDYEGAAKWIHEGSKMLGPSVIPAGAAIGAFRTLLGVGKAARVANATKKATDIARASMLAKRANALGSASNAVAVFGLSQAQNTIDNAEQTAQQLEAQGDIEGAQRARDAAQGIVPYITGAIEAAGEYYGTKYLGKLFGLDEAGVLREGTEGLVKRFLKTLGVEVGTEVGQAGTQAAAEKISGIRPNADIMEEALGVIGPTAFMTLLTGGMASAANRVGGKEKPSEPQVTPSGEVTTPTGEPVREPAVEEEKPVEATMKDWEDSTRQTGLGDDEVAKEIISKVAYGPIEEKPTEAKRVGDLKSILEGGIERGKRELKIPEPLKKGDIPGTEVDVGAQAREIARRKNAEALRSDTGRLYQERDTGPEGEGREDIQRDTQEGAEAGGAEVSREEAGPQIRVYRGAPAGSKGGWYTTDKDAAQEYADGWEDGEVVSAEINSSDYATPKDVRDAAATTGHDIEDISTYGLLSDETFYGAKETLEELKKRGFKGVHLYGGEDFAPSGREIESYLTFPDIEAPPEGTTVPEVAPEAPVDQTGNGETDDLYRKIENAVNKADDPIITRLYRNTAMDPDAEYTPGITNLDALAKVLAGHGISKDDVEAWANQTIEDATAGEREKLSTPIGILSQQSKAASQSFDNLTEEDIATLEAAIAAGVVSKETRNGKTYYKRTGDVDSWLASQEPPVGEPQAPLSGTGEAQKQAWEMTYRELEASDVPKTRYGIRMSVIGNNPGITAAMFANNQKRLKKKHRADIEQALRENKPVPPEVLAEYPDLQKTAATATESGGVGAEQQPADVGAKGKADKDNAKRNAIFSRLIKRKSAQDKGNGIYFFAEKDITPAIRNSLKSEAERNRGITGRVTPTDQFELKHWADVTGDPTARGYAVLDRRAINEERAKPKLTNAPETDFGNKGRGAEKVEEGRKAKSTAKTVKVKNSNLTEFERGLMAGTTDFMNGVASFPDNSISAMSITKNVKKFKDGYNLGYSKEYADVLQEVGDSGYHLLAKAVNDGAIDTVDFVVEKDRTGANRYYIEDKPKPAFKRGTEEPKFSRSSNLAYKKGDKIYYIGDERRGASTGVIDSKWSKNQYMINLDSGQKIVADIKLLKTVEKKKFKRISRQENKRRVKKYIEDNLAKLKNIGYREAKEGETFLRAVWEPVGDGKLQPNELDDVSLPKGKNVQAIHVTNEPENWAEILQDDYARDENYRVIEIEAMPGDIVVEDIQQTMPTDRFGRMLDSGILVTGRDLLNRKKDGIYFKRGEQSPGLPKQEVVAITKKVSKNWKGAPDFAIHSTQETLPDKVKAMIEDGDVIKGVYYDGTVHLVSPHIESEQETVKVIVHEITHYGFEKLGEKGKLLGLQIYTAKKAAIAEILKEPGYNFDVSTRRGKIQAADEWLAREAPINPESTWVDRAVRLVREFIRKLGFDVKLSDAEIRAWLADMRHVVVEGKAQAVRWGEARFMVAYHGTPHVWQPEPGFPHGRPSLDKFGTGEGGGAYGWGWYSAEMQDVADGYRSFTTDLLYNGKNIYGIGQPELEALPKITQQAVVRSRDEATIEDFLRSAKNTGNDALYKEATRLVDSGEITLAPTGSLYTLDIPDDVIQKLLDWDNPITDKQRRQILDEMLLVEKRDRRVENYIRDEKDVDGRDIYNELSRFLGGNKQASEFLARAGIPGNTHGGVSQGATGAKYVIWDQAVLDRIALLERNGEKLDAIREEQEANPDIQFMRGKGETKSTLDKDGFNLIGKFKDYISPAKLTQKGKDDLRPFLDLILQTPAFFSKRLHATRRLFDLSQTRQDNFHEEVNQIENNEGKNVIKQWNELGKDKKAWKKAADYLLDTDKNQDGFVLNFDDGKWLVKNPEGKVMKSFDSNFKDNRDNGEIAAVEFMRKQEAEWLTKNGFTDAQTEAIMAFRIATDKGFDLLISNLRKIQASYAETEMGKPPVISTFDPDGKPVKVTIQEAIALMGSMRGHYFPRIRIGGKFILRATKDGSDNILEKFAYGGPMNRVNARATELRKQGYKVDIAKDVHVGEDVFQMAGDLVKTQQLINAALEKIKSTKEDLSDEDAKAMHEEIETIFTSAVSEQIANVIRQRGSRVYMTKRSKEYWAGYETNPEIALAKYIRGISAGEAKRQMTTGMLRALTGTEINWNDYQKIAEYDGTYETFLADRIIDNPEIVTQEMFDKINDPEGINEIKDAIADLEGMLEGMEGDERKALRKELSERKAELYGRYRDYVKDMMIDQREQPEAFKWAKEYIGENTRNQETADKVIGVFRGLAVGKYLAFRVFSAPLVNLTALPTSTVASMKAAGIPYFKTYGYLTKGIKNYGKFRRGFLKGEEAKVFDHISQQGWDNPQFNSEAMTTLRSAVGRKWDKLIEVGMFTFSESEKLNRAATIAATYYGLRAQNKEASFEDLMKQAKEVSDNSHGIYNKGNYPYLALGKHPAAHIARMFYVFRTFSHTYLQNMARIGFEEKDYGALAHMVISPAIVAGAGASVMTPLINALLSAFGIDDPEEEAYRKIAELYGSGAEDLARFGLTGKAGFSTKGSLAIGIGDMPTTLQDLLGAPGSVVGDLYEAIESFGRGDVLKGTEKGLPTGVGNILRAYREYNEGLTTRTNAPLFYGREQIKPSMAEAFYRGMSFNPVRIAKIREKQWNEYKAKDKYREWATDIYAKIKRYYLGGRKDENFMPGILGEIQAYNEGAKRWGFSPITRKTIRANIRRSFKPSKFERERKQ